MSVSAAALPKSNPAHAFVVAVVPLLLIPCCMLYRWFADVSPGVAIGRCGEAMLVLGALAAAAAVVAGRAWVQHGWRSPALWLAVAVLWQAITWLGWCNVPEVGGVRVMERCAALATALAVAWLLPTVTPVALAIVGSAIIGMDVLSRLPGVGPGLEGTLGAAAFFGNTNFNAAAGMLVGVGLGWLVLARDEKRPWWLWLVVIAAAAMVASLALGKPWRGPRAGGVGLAGAIFTVACLRLLPRKLQLAAVVGGLLLMMSTVAYFVITRHGMETWGGSTTQRIFFYRSAYEAITASPSALLAGYGPATAISVLPEQHSFIGAWLSVPSYAEHSHSEWLEAPLDGGLILTVLLVGGLLATLIPLWRRREDPMCAALLVGWAYCLWHMTLESHLSQPGPLLIVALLGGASWARSAALARVTGEKEPIRLHSTLVVLPLVAAAGAIYQVVGDGTNRGNPPMVEARFEQRLNLAIRERAYWRVADLLKELRLRVGPLDTLHGREAMFLLGSGMIPEAREHILIQLKRLPVEPSTFNTARRLAIMMRNKGEVALADELDSAIAKAVAHARLGLTWVLENNQNNTARQALVQAVGAP